MDKKLVNFLSFWVGNSVVLLISSAVFGSNVVLGNDKLSSPLAAVISGLILTALLFLVPPAVEKGGYKVKNENWWPGIFLVVNVVFLWIIKRLAIVSGVGVTSIFWVIILAIFVTAVELAVAKTTGAMEKSKK